MNQPTNRYPELQRLYSDQEERSVMAEHIRQKAGNNGALDILEAGCGTRWVLNLSDIQYQLTGIDINKRALDIRKNQQKDLDIAIHGDLRTVALKENEYDIVYNSYVLEHIDGAQDVLERFIAWLKPNGILILRIPNRDSVIGFLTRVTPFWLHVLGKRYIWGRKTAGKPGHGPFPTVFDRVVSKDGIYEFCERHNLVIKAVYYSGQYTHKGFQVTRVLTRLLYWIVHILSLRRLSLNHLSLIFVIEKPADARERPRPDGQRRVIDNVAV